MAVSTKLPNVVHDKHFCKHTNKMLGMEINLENDVEFGSTWSNNQLCHSSKR